MRKILALIFVFILIAISEVIFFAKTSPIRVIFGSQTQDAYISEQLGWFALAMEAVNSLPEDAYVALLWEPRSYYCEIPCSPDVILDRWWYLMRITGSASEAASWLKEQGFTHVLLYDLGVQLERDVEVLFEPDDWIELERFKSNELLVIRQFGDAYTLYALGQ